MLQGKRNRVKDGEGEADVHGGVGEEMEEKNGLGVKELGRGGGEESARMRN